MPRLPLPIHRRWFVGCVCFLAIGLAGLSGAYAQIILSGGGRGDRVRWAKAEDFDGGFIYCRGAYTQVRRHPSGMGWATDYPAADNNFSVRLAELTRVHVRKDAVLQPTHVVVELTDPLLFRCPMLFMEDAGSMGLSGAEAQSLRDYLLKGGFLWVDDFWGSEAWEDWEQELRRVLPSGEFPVVDIPPDHAIMRSLYDVKAIPQIPSIRLWRSSPGETSELGADSQRVNFRGVHDANGRLMVVMTHNTDIADSWEREGEEPRDYFSTFSPPGYAVGVNVVLYAMTH